MRYTLLLAALWFVGCSAPALAPSDLGPPPDLVGDLATGACPPTMPADTLIAPCPSVGLQCLYGDTRCECVVGPVWICRPAACPSALDAQGACTTPGLECPYSPESAAVCVGPEDQWLSCGIEQTTCPKQPSDGALCCDSVPLEEFGCSYPNGCGGTRHCYCRNNHWQCDPLPACDLRMSDY
jgi:hypothetical protein